MGIHFGKLLASPPRDPPFYNFVVVVGIHGLRLVMSTLSRGLTEYCLPGQYGGQECSDVIGILPEPLWMSQVKRNIA
jgi:hypothetical protein